VVCQAHDNTPPLVDPNFLLPSDPEASDYRPVLNAAGNVVIYERIFSSAVTQLYFANLPSGPPQPFVPTLPQSTRADCMIYPSWYPDCRHLAVDVTTTQVNAEIDAGSGKILASPLANETVWAGFPSVNQAASKLIAFAGQNNKDSNYYNQDLNYVWVTDRSEKRPKVAPLDREALRRPGFIRKFQARAG
jgi:hypothetical protein